MFSMRMSLSGAREVTAAFAAAPGIVMEELEAATDTVMAYLQRETAERTPTAFGTLRAAWITGVTREGRARVVGELRNPLAYSMPVEMGSRPHYPPLAPLVTWAAKKLGMSASDSEVQGFARAVQRNIGAHGTPAFGMARYALQDGQPTIRAELEAAAQRMVRRVAERGATGGGAA